MSRGLDTYHKRKTKDFNKPGKLRFSERNPRGKKADWVEFALTNKETDIVMEAIGAAMQRTNDKELPAGKLLATICKEWLQAQPQQEQSRD